MYTGGMTQLLTKQHRKYLRSQLHMMGQHALQDDVKVKLIIFAVKNL